VRRRVEVVDDDHLVPRSHELVDNVRAHESGTACHQHLHVNRSSFDLDLDLDCDLGPR